MPNAIAGEAGDKTYKFITKASIDEVMAYYIVTMPKYGWKYEKNMPNEPGKYIYIFQSKTGEYIIELGGPFDLIVVQQENDFILVNIFYNPHRYGP